MGRLDLAFLLCCCRACLGSNDPNEESFYDLLGIEKDATQDDIKRAYKRQSLMMHPDKLAQKGQQVTEADQARFSRMKDAYEVLADPHKRETYDAIGEKGMKWIDEPFSVDAEEMAHNFATSSTLDRSKIFAIFVAIIIIILIQPVLVCLQVDGKFGVDTKWVTVLIPLWIGNTISMFYHIRVLMMGKIPRPDHIPEEEWVDPLPISKRIKYFIRFLLIFIFQILLTLRLDENIQWEWYIIFVPVYILEAFLFSTKISTANGIIMTLEEIEKKYGKSWADFSQADKEVMAKKYVVVPSVLSQEYTDAERQRESAKQEITRIQFRMLFVIFLLLQLDGYSNWNWWLVFVPFWFLSLCLCCGSFQHFTDVQKVAAEYLNTPPSTSDTDGDTSSPNTDYGAMEEGGGGNAGESTSRPPISEADHAEMMSRVSQAGAQAVNSCCTQLGILFMLCLIVGKIRGAGYSALWIISPFLFVSSLILCCVGCAIFGVAPVEEVFNDDAAAAAAETGTSSAMNMDYVPPNSAAEDTFIDSPPIHSPPVTSTGASAPTTAESDTKNNMENVSTTNQIQKQNVAAEQNVEPAPKIDLLDVENKATEQSTLGTNPTVPISSDTNNPNTMIGDTSKKEGHDVLDVQGDLAANGPTLSEVEDLD